MQPIPNHGYGTRSEHMAWLKKRALAILEHGNPLSTNIADAYASLSSDLNKHPETRNHVAINIGLALIVGNQLQSKQQMVEFINGIG